MLGFGQQMPMRRPPMGPSPMTAGRPNPMAGFQGGGWQPKPPGPGMGGGGPPPGPSPWGGGGQPMGPQYGGGGNPGYGNLAAPLNGPPPPGWQQHNNVQGIQADPNFQGPAMTQGYNPQAGGPQAYTPQVQGPI